jgi:nucleoside-diphosphate-sugar epimerase
MTSREAGKVALITGANRGIGFEIARQLGLLGLTVLIGTRDPGRGAEAVRRLRKEGLDARAIVIDVTDPETIGAAVREVEREFGKLDVLINVQPEPGDAERRARRAERGTVGHAAGRRPHWRVLRRRGPAPLVSPPAALVAGADAQYAKEASYE